MFFWTPYPFVRIVLFFSAGILGGIYLPESVPINFANFFVSLLTFLFLTILYLRTTGKVKNVNPGSLGLLLILFTGYIQVYNATDSQNKSHFIQDKDTIQYYKVVVVKQAQEKKNSWKLEAEVKAVQHGDHWKARSGKVLLYFSKKPADSIYTYGDVLLVKGSPQLLTEPANPGEFDYKKFLTFRKIYHQHFLRAGDALKIDHQPPSRLIDFSIRARVWADEALKRNIKGAREQATASALVLGVTDGLDNELIGAYAATGSLHVLSVSGLHVGIIYWLILLGLKPLNKTTGGKWTLAIFSIAVLWSYAFVTGLSPSVLRAVTMFSFVALAKPWSQRTNIYNTLAASAFCLLLYEPYLIMSVGFQLSYLAVLGIVYLQPIISRWWEPRQWLWDNIWQITCVSIAAQIATFALGLLYFHQFPVYFLFSNLFVIPASFVVLVLGIVLIAISAIASLAGWVGFLLEWIIRILNYGVLEMETFPFSLIDNVYITTLQCWLLIVAIMLSISMLEFRKFSIAAIITLIALAFSYIQWSHFYTKIDTRKLTIYKVSGHSAFDIIDRGQAYFFTDSTLSNDWEAIRFHIRPNRLRSGINSICAGDQLEFVRDFQGCRFIVYKGVTILQIYAKDFLFPESATFDYLIIGNNAVKNLEDISVVKFRQLILDSSNSHYFANRILKEAHKRSMNVYSVLHRGAFVSKI